MAGISVGFIGSGNLANAIIKGMISEGYIKSENIYIFDLDPQKTAALSKYGVRICDRPDCLVNQCNYIFLTVKPQVYKTVLGDIKKHLDNSKIMVSVAAGMSIASIQSMAGFDCKVIRTMPNTPALLGQGATALTKSESVSEPEFEFILNLFNTIGKTAVIPEEQMDSVVSVNGSSPAYIFLFAKAVTDYAAGQGIAPDTANRLFCQTLIGAAHMLRDSGMTPDELIRMVTSQGGTTEAAMKVFAQNDFEQIIAQAMDACTKRTVELGSNV